MADAAGGSLACELSKVGTKLGTKVVRPLAQCASLAEGLRHTLHYAHCYLHYLQAFVSETSLVKLNSSYLTDHSSKLHFGLVGLA